MFRNKFSAIEHSSRAHLRSILDALKNRFLVYSNCKYKKKSKNISLPYVTQKVFCSDFISFPNFAFQNQIICLTLYLCYTGAPSAYLSDVYGFALLFLPEKFSKLISVSKLSIFPISSNAVPDCTHIRISKEVTR